MSKIIGCKFDRDEIVIYGSSKRPIDTHKSKILEEERRKIRRDDVIIVDTGFTNNAKFYVDDSCFDNNKMSSNVKWSVVYQHAFADAKIKGGNVPSELWALNEGDTSIRYFGMNKHYKQGESLTVKLLGNSKSMYYYGYIQKVFVFTDKPEGGFTFYIIPVSKPCINFAHFENSEKNWQYGDVVNLSVNYHNLCSTRTEKLYTQVFVIEDKGSNASITAEEGSSIDFDDLEKISVWKSDELTMPQIDKESRGLNAFIEFTILIDYEKWRKGEVKEKKFSVIAVVYREEYNWGFKSYKVVAFRNFLAQPTTDLYQYNSKTLSVKDIDIKEGSISSRIRVEKDFMSEILAKREIEKNNMIQYIGDIEYSVKENNSCAYSVITVNNGKKDIEVFNEYKLDKKVVDRSERFIDIVAGDKEKKEIKVTAKFLKHKDAELEHVRTEKGKNPVKCERILNDGYPHQDIHDVFKMGWIVGQWVPSKDPSLFLERYMKKIGIENRPLFFHPSNASSSPPLQWNKPDQDAKGIESPDKEKYEAVTVAGVQGLTNEDYTINADDDSIILKLKYRYNKTVIENAHVYSSNNTVLNNLWLFRYFVLNKKKAQTYFVPVTTCRYPNQIVKIRVFPDIRWGISFTIGSIDKKHKENWREDLTEEKKKLIRYAKYEIEGDDIHTRVNKENSYIAEKKKKEKEEDERKKKNLLKRLNFKLGINASYNDSVLDFSPTLGKDLESLLYTIGLIKETFDELVGNGDHAPSNAEKEKKYLVATKKSKRLKGLAKLPISITVDYPAFTGGFAWNFREIATEGNVTPSYDIFLKASPLLAAEGKLDLLPLAEYIPVFGQAVKVVDIIVNAGGVHPDFFISAKGKVGFGLTLKIGEEDKYNQGRVGFEGDFKVRVEASVTVSPGVIGFIFSGGDAESFVTSTEYRAYGETGLTGNLLTGADEKGPYVDFSVNFSGLQFVAEKKIMDERGAFSKTEKLGPYNVLGASQLLKGKKYLVEDEKNNQK